MHLAHLSLPAEALLYANVMKRFAFQSELSTAARFATLDAEKTATLSRQLVELFRKPALLNATAPCDLITLRGEKLFKCLKVQKRRKKRDLHSLENR